MTTPTEQREEAIAAADGACPRCGAPRTADQEYCVDCGLRLPPVKGRLPSLRRRWIRRVGWYPGDWVWVSLLTLLVAIAGAAAAIAISHHARARAGRTVLAPTQSLAVHQPPPPVPATTAAVTTLPIAPEPTTTSKTRTAPAAPAVGSWPASRSGWTIVLVSYPKTNGAAAAHTTALQALHHHLPQVGILDSSGYASLQPGYLVVFTGEYGSQDAANAALATARQAGFAAAYVRQVAG